MRAPTIAVQGAYYIATGAWPLISMRTFEAVTGPKRDHWLVRQVGLLAVAIGVALCADSLHGSRRVTGDVLGAGTAVAFGAIDLSEGLPGRIRPIYLADAAIEAFFFARVFTRLLRRGSA